MSGNTDGGEDRRETFRRDRDRLREIHRDTYVETAGRKGTQRLTERGAGEGEKELLSFYLF